MSARGKKSVLGQSGLSGRRPEPPNDTTTQRDVAPLAHSLNGSTKPPAAAPPAPAPPALPAAAVVDAAATETPTTTQRDVGETASPGAAQTTQRDVGQTSKHIDERASEGEGADGAPPPITSGDQTTTQRDVGSQGHAAASAVPDDVPTKSAGRGKTVYFHPNDETRIDDLSAAVKRWNRAQQQRSREADYVRGAVGASLFARLGILLAAQLRQTDPDAFYALTKRIAVSDLEDLDA